MNTYTLELEADPQQMLALAQFVKRVGWREFSDNAVNEDEAHEIKIGVGRLQDALERAGFAPR